MCVCACVCEREKESRAGGLKCRERERKFVLPGECVCVCVCVCVGVGVFVFVRVCVKSGCHLIFFSSFARQTRNEAQKKRSFCNLLFIHMHFIIAKTILKISILRK